ncbi:MAG: phage head closure protein [Hyphomicrobiales bacterium]
MPNPIATPGRMRHRLVLEAPAGTPDGAGGRDPAWQEVAILRAAIEPVSAGSRDAADHREIAVTHRIRMRWRADVDGTMRLVKGERPFRILSVLDPDDTHRFLVIDVEEVRP